MTAFCSLFQQILQLIPRSRFDQLVAQHSAERHARGFTSWEHFVAMTYCQLGQAQSLGEICDGLASIEGKARHLGIDAPRKSTLAYANAHRPWELFESVFHEVLGTIQTELRPRHKFRFNNRLLSMDTSMIELCVTMFDWAKYKQTKGAVKLHMILDHAGHLPIFCSITDGKVSDIAIARTLDLPPGTILVVDRGYVDFGWFHQMSEKGVWFVTRLRRNDPVTVLEQRPVPGNSKVLRDEIIEVGKPKKGKPFLPVRMRRVVVQTDDGPLELVTNNETLAARTIAEIYRDRWKIETFFKTIKQNLRIRSFVGTSENALKTQIWSALLAILILKYLQMKARCGWCISRLVALLRMHLFAYRDLWNWLDNPLIKIDPPPDPQIALQFG